MNAASTTIMGTGNNPSFIVPTMKEAGDKIRHAREAKGWSQAELGKRVGISQPAIKKIEDGDTERSRYLAQIATLLDLDFNDLVPAMPDPGQILAGRDLIGTRRDLPIHAAAEGGPGAMIVSFEPIDFVPRPAPLLHVRGAYGLIIVGTSMEPEFRQGDTALINPALPPMLHEPHVFFAEKAGEGRAMIKELRRQTEESWFVHQHNPPQGQKPDFTLPKRDWRWAHRVIGTYKRR